MARPPSASRRITRSAVPGLLIVMAALGGCGLTSGSGQPGGGHDPGSTGAGHRIRVVHRAQTVRAGRRVELVDRQRIGGQRVAVDLVMQVSGPSVSHAALSSYAYAPAHGTYLTFRIAVRNNGQATVLVKPTDFTVDVAGQQRITSYDGNAPYSGAHQQLDATGLQPGQSVNHPLTFDVGGRHGVLTYAPGRKPMIRWRF